MFAVRADKTAFVEKLIRAGADIEYCNKVGLDTGW
jgi:hypothetical protein